MGIRHLNRFLQENASRGIKKMHFTNLSGKRVVIDASIYLYRFKSEGCLIENMYLLISLFKHYNIEPIFVFDGPAPKEKKELLLERKRNKEIAKENYITLKERLNEANNEFDKMEISSQIDKVKKTITTITKAEIKEVKELFDVYGVNYLTAKGEADQICSKMVQKKIAYACLSEDMDLFVYGCNRVLRYISIINCTFIMYDLKTIINDLKITLIEFKQICILSGTDYNTSNYTLFQVIKMFGKFKKSNKNNFYEWVLEKKYLVDLDNLNNIMEIFNLGNVKVFEECFVKKKRFHRTELHNFMKKQGFIYI